MRLASMLAVVLFLGCKTGPEAVPAAAAPIDAGTTPTRIRIGLVGLGEPQYELQSASFRLDGHELEAPGLTVLNGAGEHLIFQGDVAAGKHKLQSKLQFEDTSNQALSAEGGHKWKVGSEISFESRTGIEVSIQVTPELDRNAELKGRFRVKSPATAKMLAELDDGTMPPPPPEPNIELPAPPPIPSRPAALTAPIPDDSPFTPETVDLGYRLFFDRAMSSDGLMSCATCHVPEKGWTSGNLLDTRASGTTNQRNTPTVLNIATHPGWYWDGRAGSLEAVAAAEWEGQLGADGPTIAAAFNLNPELKARFKRAYGSPATPDNVPKALASFLRALTSGPAPLDAFGGGDKQAISADAQKGFELAKKIGCLGCHVPPLFSDLDFHNVGTTPDSGRRNATQKPEDEGKFKTPSLRNVALGAPYFHDGKAKTLDDAIELMAKGGPKGPLRDPKLKPAKLSKKEKAQLKAFLEALTGTSSFAAPP